MNNYKELENNLKSMIVKEPFSWQKFVERVIRWNYLAGNKSHDRSDEKYDNHRVNDYTLYNVSGTYKGFKNLELTAGIKNLFDAEPSASNVLDNFQYGYDPRYSDVTGRAYFLRGTYKF